jgi:hypothetical protein
VSLGDSPPATASNDHRDRYPPGTAEYPASPRGARWAELPGPDPEQLHEVGGGEKRVGDRLTAVQRKRGYELPAQFGQQGIAAGRPRALKLSQALERGRVAGSRETNYHGPPKRGKKRAHE